MGSGRCGSWVSTSRDACATNYLKNGYPLSRTDAAGIWYFGRAHPTDSDQLSTVKNAIPCS